MAVIEVRVRELAQLFDSLDPSPFRDKALDRHAEEYLVESAMEHAPKEPLQLRIWLPESLRGRVGMVEAAIHAHFRQMHAQAQRQFIRRMRAGRVALLIGLAVLAACLTLRGLLDGVLDPPVLSAAQEGLLILGWVAMWRPVEILVFERWESRHDRRMLDRLARIPVEIAYSDSESPAVERGAPP
jgi:hypothetical protein